MKRIIFLLLGFIGYINLANAQSGITVEASPLYTTFKFTDSESNKLNTDYAGIFTGGFGLGYRYVTEGGFMLRVGFGIRNAGATMVYDSMNYSWKLQYADAKLGLGYMLKLDKISPYLNVSGYYGLLLRGYQTINNENFDIRKAGSLNNTDFGLLITPGVQINIIYELSTFVEFNYLMGLQNLEKDDSQKSTNVAYGLTFGFLFTID